MGQLNSNRVDAANRAGGARAPAPVEDGTWPAATPPVPLARVPGLTRGDPVATGPAREAAQRPRGGSFGGAPAAPGGPPPTSYRLLRMGGAVSSGVSSLTSIGMSHGTSGFDTILKAYMD